MENRKCTLDFHSVPSGPRVADALAELAELREKVYYFDNKLVKYERLEAAIEKHENYAGAIVEKIDDFEKNATRTAQNVFKTLEDKYGSLYFGNVAEDFGITKLMKEFGEIKELMDSLELRQMPENLLKLRREHGAVIATLQDQVEALASGKVGKSEMLDAIAELRAEVLTSVQRNLVAGGDGGGGDVDSGYGGSDEEDEERFLMSFAESVPNMSADLVDAVLKLVLAAHNSYLSKEVGETEESGEEAGQRSRGEEKEEEKTATTPAGQF